jgi:WD40 repeat protein
MGDFQGMFQAFDLNTQQSLYSFSGRRVGATSAAYGPDGKSLATVSREGCLTLWDLSHWRTRTLAGSPMMPVRSLAFSADGNGLAIGTDDAVPYDNTATEDVPTAPNLRRFISPQSALGRLSGRPIKLDGAPWDASGPGFRIWDLADGREREPLGTSLTLTSIPLIAWSAQGIVAAGSRDGTVWIWDIRSSQLVTRFAVNPTGQDVISWKSTTGRPLPTHGALKRLDGVVALTFSWDGGKLAVATKSGIVQIVDTENWEDRTMLCTDAASVACLVFSPTGSTLVANRRGQIICWNLVKLKKSSEHRLIGRESDLELCSAMFTHDGRILAVGRQDGTVQLVDAEPLNHWDGVVADDVPRRTLKGHLDRAVSVSFSPDDQTLATGSWDATVRLWHVASGQEVAVFKAHQGKVEAVAFSPDGMVLATGGQRDPDHGEVFLWRATP